ncbi:MAG: VanZ family protein [Gammaproteobacteria bacterium]|nr:VanZ family protein [Gammaproteobacteria bacterium]
MLSLHKTNRMHRLWWVLGWLMIAVILYLSLMPSPPKVGAVSDKWQHAFAYALLMSWFAQLTFHRWRTALLLVVMGVGVEFIQGWSGLRYYERMDMVANTAGVLIGWLMFRLGFHYLSWLEKPRKS